MKQHKSAKHYLLEALLPFTESNLKLAFKPSLFFKDLEKLHNLNQLAAQTAYYRAQKSGFITLDDQGIPQLTKKGLDTLKPFQAKRLNHARLMVIFDIPEDERWKRRQLRAVLREFSFKQVQQSVWISELDSAEYVKEQIAALELAKHVRLFEALPL